MSKEAACQVHACQWPKSATTNTIDFTVKAHEKDCMSWDGSLNHFTMEELEQSDTDDKEEFMELEGDELLQSLQHQDIDLISLILSYIT